MFQDLIKLGNAAGEMQFINLCFFLRQRFSFLNDILIQLHGDVRTARDTAILERWMYDSSQTKIAVPWRRK
jgi:hypothetical protein